MLCHDLGGWHAGSMREAEQGGDMSILIPDSHYCTTETSVTSYSNYPPIKNKFKAKQKTLVIHSWYNTKIEPNVNYGLWMTMMYQRWPIHCNKHNTLVWGVHVGRGGERGRLCVAGLGVYGNSLYVLLHSAANLTLLLKN